MSAQTSPVPAGGLPVVELDGLRFRDLDHDGVVAPYEDWRLDPAARAQDLLGRMTLAEKFGTLLHGSAPSVGPMGVIGVGEVYDLDRVAELVTGRGITSLITRLTPAPREFAEQNNALQRVAAAGRLGIPVVVSSDPRHHFAAVIGASNQTSGFSRWPEPLGLAAIGEEGVVRELGATMRRDYRAVGLHMFLGPQADLATSPRWPRAEGTFGEDPALVGRLVGAFVAGLQDGIAGLGPTSVAAVVKHWVGYGASRDGFDGHNWYGRFSAFPSGALGDHVEAFRPAFAARVAGVMPTYNILDGVALDGVPVEPVGAGFSGQLVDGLLRRREGFEGFVVSDWGITRDLTESGRTGVPPQTPDLIAMPWGVETLTRAERFARCLNAGVDQLGGEDDPEPFAAALAEGLLGLDRVDQAVLRLLVARFRLGLFDAPLVDPDAAARVVGAPAAHAAAAAAERAALTWLQVADGRPAPLLPPGSRVHLDGLEPAAAQRLGLRVVEDPAAADVAVVRVEAPHELLHPGHFFGRIQHEGALDFPPDGKAAGRLRALCRAVATVVVVHLDRPAVLTGVVEDAAAVLADFGAGDDAVLEVLAGAAEGRGRLPFRLHASMPDAVAQPCDRPSADLPGRFPVGHRAAP